MGEVLVATDGERQRVLDAMIPRYFPSRLAGRDYDPMPNAHVQATVVIAMTIDEASTS